MNEVKKIPAIHGFYWVRGAWDMFNASRTGWLFVVGCVLLAILFVGQIMLILPLSVRAVLTFLIVLLFPVLWSGLMISCAKLEQRGELSLINLLDGFYYQGYRLVSLGGIYFALSLVVDIIVGLVGGDELQEFLQKLAEAMVPGTHMALISAMNSHLIFSLGLFILLSAGLMSAYWFAPTLVALKNQKPIEALKNSLIGLTSNFSAFLLHVFLIAGICVTWFAITDLGLYFLPSKLEILFKLVTFAGYFFLVVASAYLSFKDIFGAAELLPEGEEEI